MKKDVLISIQGLQSMDDPGTDEVTLTTEGRFYRKADNYYLVYDESEVTGFEDTRTTVKISGDGQGVTEYGGITIAVATRSIDSSLTDDGGRIHVDYDIEFQHAHLSSNSLTIDVRPLPLQPGGTVSL